MCAASACITSFFFFFNDTATTEIYTLSLHDALPISIGRDLAAIDEHERRPARSRVEIDRIVAGDVLGLAGAVDLDAASRSEEHTSELQSRQYLVCRLLLEKKTRMNRVSSLARGVGRV